jgi:flagellar M-ring protein FliF
MVDVINDFSTQKKVSFFSLVLIIVVAFIGGIIWLVMPKYAPLFSDLDESMAAETIVRLEEQQIPFDVIQDTDGNTIMVPQENVEQLRVTLSSQLGLPEVQGLELFDNADYGMTDFSQDVTYKRALQGELARTISSMPDIKSSRVHITFAPKRLFSSQQQEAKASVYVEQQDNVQLVSAQIAGIQKLVANATERLEAHNVSVFSHDGAELSEPLSTESSYAMDKKHQAKYDIEQRLTDKAYRLLTLAISPERIAVSVDVKLNFDQIKRMKQGYSNDQDGGGFIAKQREVNLTKEADDKPPVQATPVITSERETEFKHGQETEETIFSSGKIERINVGVALREDITPEQVRKISDVLSAGLGLDTFRGDKLAVEVLNIDIPKPLFEVPVITKTPIEPPSAVSVTEHSTATLDNSLVNSLEASFNPWWLLFLLIPAPLYFLTQRQQQLGEKEREQLLIEVKDWLQREESAHGEL